MSIRALAKAMLFISAILAPSLSVAEEHLNAFQGYSYGLLPTPVSLTQSQPTVGYIPKVAIADIGQVILGTYAASDIGQVVLAQDFEANIGQVVLQAAYDERSITTIAFPATIADASVSQASGRDIGQVVLFGGPAHEMAWGDFLPISY